MRNDIMNTAKALKSKLSFSTLGCPDWSWNDILHYGTQFGFQGVELRLLKREVDLLSCPEFQSSELSTRRRELQSAGFQVCGLASSVRFHDPGDAERRSQLDTGRRYLDLACELGADFVRVFGDVIPTDAQRNPDKLVETLSWIAEGLDQLGEYAQRCERQILIETHGDFADSALMEKLMQRVTAPAVGVLWDTHHPWRFYQEEIEAAFNRLRRWTQHTHWKDSISDVKHEQRNLNTVTTEDQDDASKADRQARELMAGHRPSHYVLMGAGDFPTEQTLQLLIDSDYRGWLSLEWEKMWHPEIDPPELALPEYVRIMHEALNQFIS